MRGVGETVFSLDYYNRGSHSPFHLSTAVTKRLDPGSSMRLTGMTRYIVWFGLFRGRAAEVCSAEATELPVRERPPVSVANGLCHPLVMTRYIVGSLTTLLPMVFSNLYPADLVDPVIRVLSSISPFHDLFVAPIYGGWVSFAKPGSPVVFRQSSLTW